MIKYGEKNDGKYIKDSKRHGIQWKYLTMCNWNLSRKGRRNSTEAIFVEIMAENSL